MSRLFDGVDDNSVHTLGTSNLQYGTIVAVLKRSGASWASIVGNHNASAVCRVGMMFNAGDQLCWFDDNALKYTTAITGTSAMGWILCAVTKATGTTSPRIHLYRWDTTTWQHADNTIGTVADRQDQTGGTIRIGVIDGADFFAGRIAAVAEKGNATPLTDGEIESLVSTFTRANWDSLGLTFLTDELDAFATDYGGTSTQSSLTGTADDADDPTGWASWAGGAATTSYPPVPSFRATSSLYRR